MRPLAGLALVSFALSVAVSPVGAQPAYLVKDIAVGQSPLDGAPTNLTPCGSGLYFAARTRTTGTELWRTDGVTTSMVKDLRPGAEDGLLEPYTTVGGISGPQFVPWNEPHMGCYGGLLYFAGRDGSDRGVELWVTDGSDGGTRPVTRGLASPPGPPWGFTVVNGLLYFVGTWDLWRTDGTTGGTVRQKTGIGSWGSDKSDWPELLALGDALLVLEHGHDSAVWRADASGVAFLRRFTSAQHLVAADGYAAFLACTTTEGCEPWRTDGTEAGTRILRDVAPGPDSSYAYPLAAVGSTVYLTVDSPGASALWKTDGSSAGTVLVRAGLPPSWHTGAAFQGSFFFTAGPQLWKSDGTGPGTVPVRQFLSGTGSYYFLPPVAVGSLLFFGGDDGADGLEVWKSDGTIAGTGMVTDINPGAVSSLGYWSPFVAFQGRAWFAATDPTHGAELWKSDGTAAGTVLVKDVEPTLAGAGSTPQGFVSAEGLLYFVPTGIYPRRYWRSDGTDQGTWAVSFDLQNGERPVAFGTRVLFRDGTTLSISDGTPGGTQVLHTFSPGTHIGTVQPFRDRAFFDVSGGKTDGVWSTDGTAAGTRLDVPLDGASLVGSGGGMIWIQKDVEQLWASDGTPGGTRLVHDFGPAPYTRFFPFTGLPGAVVFGLGRNSATTEIWCSDGTPGGTFLAASGPSSSFAATPTAVCFSDGAGLWWTDGSVRGTHEVLPGVVPSWMVASGARVFFIRWLGNLRSGLFITDGTAAGTRLLKAFDYRGASAATYPGALTAAPGRVYFNAWDPQHGTELWTSDGTPCGTQLVQDIGPGGFSSNPWPLAVSGDRLFFGADDGVHGRELWALPIPAPPRFPSPCPAR